MVRGNWQKRVETAEARKVASKQRKQHRDSRGVNKSRVHDFLQFLDRHYAHIQRPCTLHLWTDTCPSDYRQDSWDTHPDDQVGGNRKQRYIKGKKREAAGKKKSHPRSNKRTDEVEEHATNTSLARKLCGDYFFIGKCQQDRQKKGGGSSCRHVHYSDSTRNDSMTLHDVTMAGVVRGDSEVKESLAQSLQAAILASAGGQEGSDVLAEEGGGGIDMVYHVPVELFTETVASGKEQEEKEGEADSTIYNTVAKVLSAKSCGLGSIVYGASNNTLLFDRHRGGSLLSEECLVKTFAGRKQLDERKLPSSTSGIQASNNAVSEGIKLLFSPILEHILTFLPDACVCVMRLVCKTWHNEIGTTSPDLWRYLIQRNNWPMPVIDQDTETAALRHVYYDTFTSHYSVVRSVSAIHKALFVLETCNKTIKVGGDCAIQNFSTRRGAPQAPSFCVGVQVWSPNRVLAAYSLDCTLRLFEAIAKPSDNSSSFSQDGKLCREVTCVCVSPYQHTKKKTCQLIAMDVDQDMVVCLVRVTDNDGQSNVMLTSMSREDFLCCSGSETAGLSDDSDLQMIDICNEFRDHNDFHEEDIVCGAADSIVACGNGKALVALEANMRDTDDAIPLVNALVMFSVATGTIVWTETVPIISDDMLEFEYVTLACSHTPRGSRRRRTASHIGVAAHHCPVTLSTVIDQTGSHVSTAQLSGLGWRERSQHEEWSMLHHAARPVVVTASEVIVAECFCHVNGGDRKTCQVSFFPHVGTDTTTTTDVLVLECEDGWLDPFRMENLGDTHVVILCRIAVAGEDHGAPLQDFYDYYVSAIIVHISTRKELKRFSLLLGNDGHIHYNFEYPIFMSALADTIGVGVACKGMILTGNDIRSVGRDVHLRQDENDRHFGSAKKKKKKRQRNSNGSKKDGFARGMSLRG